MKLIKMFGLAMVSAIAAMAFIGASSASADTFCLTAAYEDPCPAGKAAPAGTELASELKEGKAVLTGALNVECNVSTVAGKITTNSAPEVLGNITALTFTTCTNCTEITAKELGVAGKWNVAVNWKSFTGGVQSDDFKVTNVNVELQKCPLGIQCTATAPTGVVLDLTSTGAAQTLKAVNEPLSLGICGNGTWNATYKLTKPLPSWVTAAP